MRFLFRNFNITNPFYKTWLGIFGAAALFAAFDSILVLFKPLTVAISGLGLESTYATVVTVVLCFIYLYVIDYGLSVFYPTAIQTIVSNVRSKVTDKALWSIAILTLVFCIVQIAITIGVSFYLRHESAKMAIEKPVLTDITALSQVKIDPSVKSLDSDIERLKSEKNKAVIASQKHKELQKEAAAGNGWAINKLKERSKDAALPFEKELTKIQASKAKIIETNTAVQLAAITGANFQNQFLVDNYQKQSEHLANFLLYFAVCATIIECFAGLMLGIYKAIYGIGGIKPLTPQKTVITDSSKTAKKETVITDSETVITEKEGIKADKILVNDSFIREIMTNIKAEINNLKTGNGKDNSILQRLGKKIENLDHFLNRADNVTAAVMKEGRELYNKCRQDYFTHA